jgi:hypothetical protein
MVKTFQNELLHKNRFGIRIRQSILLQKDQVSEIAMPKNFFLRYFLSRFGFRYTPEFKMNLGNVDKKKLGFIHKYKKIFSAVPDNSTQTYWNHQCFHNRNSKQSNILLNFKGNYEKVNFITLAK